MDSLRVLSILKHGRGWLVDDLSQRKLLRPVTIFTEDQGILLPTLLISDLAGRFPMVETLTLEGFVNMARYRYVPLKVNMVIPSPSDHVGD